MSTCVDMADGMMGMYWLAIYLKKLYSTKPTNKNMIKFSIKTCHIDKFLRHSTLNTNAVMRNIARRPPAIANENFLSHKLFVSIVESGDEYISESCWSWMGFNDRYSASASLSFNLFINPSIVVPTELDKTLFIPLEDNFEAMKKKKILKNVHNIHTCINTFKKVTLINSFVLFLGVNASMSSIICTSSNSTLSSGCNGDGITVSFSCSFS